MIFGQNEVIDLEIYNEDGKHITTMDFLKEGDINVKNAELIVYTEVLNTELLEFMYDKEKNQLTDFEKRLNKNGLNDTLLVKSTHINCKLIASTYVRNVDGKDRKVIYEIPKAKLFTGQVFESSCIEITSHKLKFNILPFDESGHLFKIHMRLN